MLFFFIFLPAPPPGLNCQSNVTIEIEYNKKVAKRFANMARLLSAELLDSMGERVVDFCKTKREKGH